MKWSGKLQRDFPLQKIRAQVYDLNQSGTAEATAFRLLWKHEQAEGFFLQKNAPVKLKVLRFGSYSGTADTLPYVRTAWNGRLKKSSNRKSYAS